MTYPASLCLLVLCQEAMVEKQDESRKPLPYYRGVIVAARTGWYPGREGSLQDLEIRLFEGRASMLAELWDAGRERETEVKDISKGLGRTRGRRGGPSAQPGKAVGGGGSG